MVKVSKKNLLLALVTIAVLILGWWGIGVINKNDAKRLQNYVKEAQQAGLVRGKEECYKESLGSEVCNSLFADTSITECGGMTCWIVYVQSKGPEYAASVTVNRQDDRYVVIDYLRNTGTQEE